ncbi:MAG: hypothetical protein RL277_2477 [Planctomycetota bacterium]|jgi:hypothetical protein
MAEVRNKRRTPSQNSRWILLGGVVLFAALGAGTLHALGVIRVPGLPGGVSAKEDRTGKTAVWVTSRKVSAFDKVAEADLVDPKGQPAIRWLDAEDVKEKGFISNRGDILGRVLKNDKGPGYAFKESDFYPRGTPASPSAAIEAGFVGIWTDPKDIDGLSKLERGELFQILGITERRDGAQAQAKDIDTKEAQSISSAFGAATELIVHHGRVIVGLGSGKQDKEMFLEMSAEDVERLASAQRRRAALRCVTLSTTAPIAEREKIEAKDRPDTQQIMLLDGKGGRETIVPKASQEKQR